jgi:hypothetical protein
MLLPDDNGDYDYEIFDLFQLIEVFLATGYGDWRKFQEKNISLHYIQEGSVLLYDKKINEFKALFASQLYPKPAPPSKPVSWKGLTFAEMRKMNGLIPDHLLTTGRRVELYFKLANLVPQDRPCLCKTYYCLLVYEMLTRDRMVPPEKLERGLQHAWNLFTSHVLYGTIYNMLTNNAPEEFVEFLGITVGQAP